MFRSPPLGVGVGSLDDALILLQCAEGNAQLILYALTPFIQAYGKKSDGSSKRKDEGDEGRFRKFTREDIQARGDNLDITWLRDESVERAEDLPQPDEIAAEIMTHLQAATEEMEALMELLEPTDGEDTIEVGT